MKQLWRVYLLRCADNSYYCGITADITRRLRQHNGEITGGARYTSTRRPVSLLHVTDTMDRVNASRIEFAVKKLPRGKKLAFLRNLVNAGH